MKENHFIRKNALQGLYSPANEHDACGVGMIVNLHGAKSHELIDSALKVLENMKHRGAEGADSKTGDGAGIMVQIPHEFILLQGIPVPEKGKYGTGLVFMPKDKDAQQDIMSVMIEEIERNIKSEISSSFAHDIAVQLEKIKMPAVLPNGEVSNSSDTAVTVSKYLGKTILKFGLKGSKLAGTVESGNILSGINFAQSGLAGLSGSMLHEMVKGVGSFVGFKFAPWGALKWAKALGTIGVVLSIISVLKNIYDLITSEDKQRDNEEKVRDARNDVRKEFNNWANKAYEELTKAVETQMNNLMDAEITETKKVLQTFQDRRDLLKLRKEKLDDIFAKEQKLMQDIEQNIA